MEAWAASPGTKFNKKICNIMEIIIMIIAFFAWIGEALKDGGKID